MRDREYLATCINSSAQSKPIANICVCIGHEANARVHQSRQVNSRSGRSTRQRKYPKKLCATTDEIDSHLNINIDAPVWVHLKGERQELAGSSRARLRRRDCRETHDLFARGRDARFEQRGRTIYPRGGPVADNASRLASIQRPRQIRDRRNETVPRLLEQCKMQQPFKIVRGQPLLRRETRSAAEASPDPRISATIFHHRPSRSIVKIVIFFLSKTGRTVSGLLRGGLL